MSSTTTLKPVIRVQIRLSESVAWPQWKRVPAISKEGGNYSISRLLTAIRGISTRSSSESPIVAAPDQRLPHPTTEGPFKQKTWC